MTGLLAGRTALVTGGTAGIGRGIAEVLALHGARVAVTGVTEERCAQAREDGLDVYQLDVRDKNCLLYTSPSPRDKRQSRMPSSA